ncbi:MAG: hypothetical protein ACD_50C00376G0002 [uncultured bacterium]|nr:MAG: hypothetical protein ACD_50C00376G0002 [uncultured bacterium]
MTVRSWMKRQNKREAHKAKQNPDYNIGEVYPCLKIYVSSFFARNFFPAIATNVLMLGR